MTSLAGNIAICNEISKTNNYLDLSFITKDTSAQDFDVRVKTFKNFKLGDGARFGWNALSLAAYKGNLELVKHIIKISEKSLINLGTLFGWTPLFCAANCKDLEAGFLVAKELIKLNADINFATKLICNNKEIGYMPKDATPLWVAATKTKNLQLVKLLLERGAVFYPENEINNGSNLQKPLSKEVIDLINKAKQMIQEEKLLKMRAENFVTLYFCNNSPVSQLPKDVIKLIYDEICQNPSSK